MLRFIAPLTRFISSEAATAMKAARASAGLRRHIATAASSGAANMRKKYCIPLNISGMRPTSSSMGTRTRKIRTSQTTDSTAKSAPAASEQICCGESFFCIA